MEGGRVSFDGAPTDFLAWSADNDPVLTTPAARLFSLSGLDPLPVGVRQARQLLASNSPGRQEGGTPSERLVLLGRPALGRPHPSHPSKLSEEGVPPSRPPALEAKGLWVELDRGEEMRDVLKGVDLAVRRGERVALMGRNGAGKSTLLRTAAGLHESVAGKIDIESIALLTQNSGDYLVRERVGDELPGDAGAAALRAVGLEHAVDADPRDLSGGERQRLALGIALAGRMDGEELPGLVALDEPTRGMDRARKEELVALIENLAGRGAAVVVATHDVEFAAEFAERVVLLGDGVVIADGPSAEILSGGWYFATEVARVLDLPGVVTPEQGAAALAGGER
ncbi:MAG TPA: ATP-binding cassette domain-containing protein, partial [Solirubrobacterales bacterium]|nr:ATP-binding cassette domain-containing protein [Solirubrobacterales bacterium]